MSERGSFVTEYIYCTDCWEALKAYLLPWQEKYCHAFELVPYKIIAGKIGGLYRGEEADTFDDEFRRGLEPLLCHDTKIAVLCDYPASSAILTMKAGKEPRPWPPKTPPDEAHADPTCSGAR